MNINNQSIIGKIVAENYKAASIFKRYNIDFCCNGNRTIGTACDEKKLNEELLIEELSQALSVKESGDIDFASFPLDLLADYIEKTHHRYVESKIPEITPYLRRIVEVHDDNHPELYDVEDLFLTSSQELSAHMKKEELLLFPHIRQLVKAKLSGGQQVRPSFGTVANPIAQMMHEHDAEGERFRIINELTNNYAPPEDACNTYRVTLSLLNEFEDDLHRHIHLENNILFPKSIELEKAMNA